MFARIKSYFAQRSQGRLPGVHYKAIGQSVYYTVVDHRGQVVYESWMKIGESQSACRSLDVACQDAETTRAREQSRVQVPTREVTDNGTTN